MAKKIDFALLTAWVVNMGFFCQANAHQDNRGKPWYEQINVSDSNQTIYF